LENVHRSILNLVKQYGVFDKLSTAGGQWDRNDPATTGTTAGSGSVGYLIGKIT
jgi:hypothetical protein